MKGGNITLPEIAETLEGAIRILEDEAGEDKNPRLTVVSVALGRCLEEIERMWDEESA